MAEVIRFQAVGRRKEAIARVTLVPGSGNFSINGRKFEDYFARETDRLYVKQPFALTNAFSRFDCIARITGGGLSGQAGALRLGISRAIAMADEVSQTLLRKEGLLRRDPRMKERKKYGQKGARKRFQWTKR